MSACTWLNIDIYTCVCVGACMFLQVYLYFFHSSVNQAIILFISTCLDCSLLINLRCQLHTELAKCEESKEQIQVAMEHLKKVSILKGWKTNYIKEWVLKGCLRLKYWIFTHVGHLWLMIVVILSRYFLTPFLTQNLFPLIFFHALTNIY